MTGARCWSLDSVRRLSSTTQFDDSVRRRDTYRSVANSDRRLARIFSALSNPNRVKIYNELLRAEKASYDIGHRCLLSDVVRTLKIKSPTISHHVKELVDAGL